MSNNAADGELVAIPTRPSDVMRSLSVSLPVAAVLKIIPALVLPTPPPVKTA